MRMRLSPVERVLGPLLWDPKFVGREKTTGNASAVRRLVGPRSPSINVTISRQKNDLHLPVTLISGQKHWLHVINKRKFLVYQSFFSENRQKLCS